MNKKKYWLLLSFIVIFVMIGCYLLGAYINQTDNNSYSSETQSYNTSLYNSQASKDYSGKPSEQITQTDHMAGERQQMVYHADIYLEVNKLHSAKNELDKIVKQTNAIIVSSSDTEKFDERNLNINYNVPQNKFQLFLDHIKKISNTPPDIQIQSDDVSEELVDLTARIKAKKAMEARLLAMMSKATTTSDLLDIENTLGTTQEQLEQLTGRQQYLKHRVAFSTITVELRSSTYQPLQTKYSLLNEISQGFIHSCNNLWIGLQLFIIWLATASPYFILIIIIAIPLGLLIKKHKKE
ncbi:DUF4349 domain-containing protein [Shimazuella sp. AN120528]|uniref:DUF4349 domain-containing protein n=1 Tax=Shimazuella soli TaxID=1892854 RepID=UPI001F0EBC4C|nr:DUF4349 domain-containing protein [Shimazuella soli]MCH5585706.1 DUF4349 domain-containing protein [Shimazuella soli]